MPSTSQDERVAVQIKLTPDLLMRLKLFAVKESLRPREAWDRLLEAGLKALQKSR